VTAAEEHDAEEEDAEAEEHVIGEANTDPEDAMGDDAEETREAGEHANAEDMEEDGAETDEAAEHADAEESDEESEESVKDAEESEDNAEETDDDADASDEDPWMPRRAVRILRLRRAVRMPGRPRKMQRRRTRLVAR
jgi:hypothetical protein